MESLKGWTLRPLDERPLRPGKSLIITLTDLITDMPDGPTSCYCQVDMPVGQRNGRDVPVKKTIGPIIKSKTIIANDRVGIGTGKPGSTLEVNGAVRARGGDPGNYGMANNGFFFTGTGDTDSGMSSLANGDLALFVNDRKAVEINNTIVGNTVNDHGQVDLTIKGNIKTEKVDKTNGNIDVSGKLTGQGDLEVAGKIIGHSDLTIDANLSAGGRIQDKTGDVMPVGSILAFCGTEAPDGWLLCWGQGIPYYNDAYKKLYGKLYQVLGSPELFIDTNTNGNHFRIPDLRDRFIVSTGSTY